MSNYLDSDSDSDSDSSSLNNTINFAGLVLNKKYIPIYKLGAGAFATVWFSFNFKNKTYYAIKIQNNDEFSNGLDEADLQKNLNKSKCKFINKMEESFVYKDNHDKYVCVVFKLQMDCLSRLLKK
jgi:serine/threonine protein kinase